MGGVSGLAVSQGGVLGVVVDVVNDDASLLGGGLDVESTLLAGLLDDDVEPAGDGIGALATLEAVLALVVRLGCIDILLAKGRVLVVEVGVVVLEVGDGEGHSDPKSLRVSIAL